MRRLKVLAAVPLLAGLLFVGAAPAAAQVRSVEIPPVLPWMPYVNFWFPCEFPTRYSESTLQYQNEVPPTRNSVVVLTDQGFDTAHLGDLGLDINFMKCIFSYPVGTIEEPYMAMNFGCHYENNKTHWFQNSSLIVRETFAILWCWDDPVSKVD